MGKMETTLDDKLPAFQKYLLEKNLAPAKNVPFLRPLGKKSSIFIIIGEICRKKFRHNG